MTYSYTQIAQYLRCPRSLPLSVSRRLAGEGQSGIPALRPCFEKALAAFFAGEDAPRYCSRNGAVYQEAQVEYSQGRQLGADVPARSAAARTAGPRQPDPDRSTSAEHAGQAHPAAFGRERLRGLPRCGRNSDGKPSLLEWKTTTARYPEEPEGLLALDPQLICYSWISGISDVAVVAFVRKTHLRDSVSQDHDQRPTAAGVRPIGWQPPSARSKPASLPRTAASASPERMCELRPVGAVPGQPAACRSQTRSAVLERATLIGLTILTTNGRPLVPPKLNRRRALLVLSKIDEILAWEKNSGQERDSVSSIWVAISARFGPGSTGGSTT